MLIFPSFFQGPCPRGPLRRFPSHTESAAFPCVSDGGFLPGSRRNVLRSTCRSRHMPSFPATTRTYHAPKQSPHSPCTSPSAIPTDASVRHMSRRQPPHPMQRAAGGFMHTSPTHAPCPSPSSHIYSHAVLRACPLPSMRRFRVSGKSPSHRSTLKPCSNGVGVPLRVRTSLQVLPQM